MVKAPAGRVCTNVAASRWDLGTAQQRPAPSRIGVLVSGAGTNLVALLHAIDRDPGFGGQVVVVGTDRGDAGALDHAQAAGISTVTHPIGGYLDRGDWEAALADDLTAHRVDAVVLAGFMRLLSGQFLARWPDRVVNIHPSLLPSFPGANAVADALAHGVKVTGVTVHLVDEGVDTGPIVAQRAVEVHPDDDLDRLQARIRKVEHELLTHCVRLLCHARLRRDGRRVIVTPSHAPSATSSDTPFDASSD